MSEVPQVDLVIRGGRIIDPHSGLDGVRDVLVHRGRIAGVSVDASSVAAANVVDATGKLVVPGLIDLHSHVYYKVSGYGAEPDRVGIHSGVTHVNDMGSTGSFTLLGFRHWIARTARTDVTCFVNVVGFGIEDTWGGVARGSGPSSIRTDELIRLTEDNPRLVRGIKCHFEPHDISWFGHSMIEAAARARDACHVPMYVHLGTQAPPSEGGYVPDADTILEEAYAYLKPGDVVGHIFSQRSGALLQRDGTVNPAAREIGERGLITEVGYGGGTTFAVARAVMDYGIMPDVISSDVHGIGLGQSPIAPDLGDMLSYTMVGTMTKLLALGMSLTEVIRASTETPARVLKLDHIKGRIAIDLPADLTILDLATGDWELCDVIGERIRTDRVLVPTTTIKDGEVFPLHVWSMPEFQQELVDAGLRHPGLSLAHPQSKCRALGPAPKA